LPFKRILTDSKGYRKKSYRSSERACSDCPLRAECCGKVTKFKKIEDSIHKPLYDEMHEKLRRDPNYTRFLTKRRSSRVEPVLGTLIPRHESSQQTRPDGCADLQPEKIPEVYYPQNSPQHSNHEPSKREVWVWRYLLATASPVQI